jgi:tryptophan synthase alpha chain
MQPDVLPPNRLDARFARLKAEGRRAFVAYTVACDPSFDDSLERMLIYARAGVDAIEIGFPFSDPILDGDTIRTANRRAIAAGGNLMRAFELCAAFRTQDGATPLVLMGYAAPIVSMGYAKFAENAARAGIDGVIVADMPLREANGLLAALAQHGLVMIPLSAPNLPPTDFAMTKPGLGGFLYCIPVIGATGGPSASRDEVAEAVARCRAVSRLPVLVGFGVKTPEMAAEVAHIADGVIVATALLDKILALMPAASPAYEETVIELIRAYRDAIDVVSPSA